MLCISNNIISVTDGCKCPENRSGTDGWLSPSVKSQPHRRFRCWGGTAVTVWLRSVLIPTQNTTELIWHRKRKPCQYYVFFWESADGKDSLSMCRNQTRGEWVYGAGRRATTGRRVRTQCMTVRKRVGGVCDLSLFLTAVRQQCRFKQHTVHANHMWGTLNTSTANRRLLSTRCIQFFGSWHNFETKTKNIWISGWFVWWHVSWHVKGDISSLFCLSSIQCVVYRFSVKMPKALPNGSCSLPQKTLLLKRLVSCPAFQFWDFLTSEAPFR